MEPPHKRRGASAHPRLHLLRPEAKHERTTWVAGQERVRCSNDRDIKKNPHFKRCGRAALKWADEGKAGEGGNTWRLCCVYVGGRGSRAVTVVLRCDGNPRILVKINIFSYRHRRIICNSGECRGTAAVGGRPGCTGRPGVHVRSAWPPGPANCVAERASDPPTCQNDGECVLRGINPRRVAHEPHQT